MEIETFKLKEAEKSLNKLEAEIKMKEQSLVEMAKELEPEEHISIFNIKNVVEQQKAINLALKMEKDKNSLLLKEKESLNQTIKDKVELILTQNQGIQNQQEKLSEIENELSFEKDKTNDILNIKVSDERMRQVYLDEAKQKIKSLNIKTVRRDNEHWNKYYKDHSIIHVPISKLTTKILNDFFNAIITKFNLSNREYNNMKSIMIALMRIAIDEEIIVENPMNGIYIKAKFRAVRKKSDGSKLYLNDEYDIWDTHLEEESIIEALCIQLMFQLGVRIGEAVALKFSDIEYGKIAIQRMEEKVLVFDGGKFKSAGVQIVEHLKKENDSEYRFISLTDVAKEIIKKARKLNPEGEFIFERNGE